MFKVSYRNTRSRFKICTKPKDRQNDITKLKPITDTILNYF